MGLAVDSARRPGVRFVDARLLLPRVSETLVVRNGQAETLAHQEDRGIGIRVLRPRGWGFAATSQLTRGAIRSCAHRAERLARLAEGTRSSPAPWVEETRGPRNGRYATPVREDPFTVPIERKLNLLREAERAVHTGPRVKSGRASLSAFLDRKWYASSDGASYQSTILQVGAGIEATAIGEGEVQRRSYPTSFGGDYAQGGFEFVSGLDLVSHAAECGHLAERLLTAPSCPRGRMDLVLSSDQLALQIHESVGHATELDRVLGYEAGYAGTSFLYPRDQGSLRYGSEQMTIEADATIPGGLGTFPWDDEGVPGQRYPLVKEGRLVSFLSSRSSAGELGLSRSGGTARADGWARTPLVRMTNVNLPPGSRSVPDLLSEVCQGIYLETNRSWSIDDKRLNFQFGTEVGRLIRQGELRGYVRNPLYSGITPEFWGSLEARADASSWHLWGIPNCGKGQPGQVGRVGHGAPWALFRQVQVGGGS